MRTVFDFSPLYRSSIGFDRVFDLLENAKRVTSIDNWPPYDVARTGKDDYRITMALAGFGQEELSISQEQNVLIVTGEKNGEDKAEAEPEATAPGGAQADGDDEGNPSLGAMEQELLPVVIEKFDSIADAFKKLDRLQDKRLTSMRKGEKVTTQSDRRQEKLLDDLKQMMGEIRLNNARIDELLEGIYVHNRRLVALEGANLSQD